MIKIIIPKNVQARLDARGLHSRDKRDHHLAKLRGVSNTALNQPIASVEMNDKRSRMKLRPRKKDFKYTETTADEDKETFLKDVVMLC